MGKLIGCTLILTGAAVAGVTILLADHLDARPAHGTDIVEVVAAPPVPPPGAVPATGPKVTLGERPARAMPVATAVSAAERKPIAPFVTVTVPNDPVAIARALQGELRRVGCYDGESNGVWSGAARKAMKSFTDRVNASLPVDRPDYILLSLVQAHAGKACGPTCPSGQGMSEAGRCLPLAMVAHAHRKPAPARVAHVQGPGPSPVTRENLPDVVASLLAPRPEANPPIESDTPRMGLAGPTADAAPKPEEKTEAQREKEKKAQRDKERERERRIVREHKPAAFGQTRWARDFFRGGATF